MKVNGTAVPVGGVVYRLWSDLPDLISLLVFFAVTAALFRSLEFALIVTASLGFHELGHAALLSHLRLKWRISFGIVGAWTWSSAAERKKLTNLANSTIHLAGPIFSILLALAAFSASKIFPHDATRLLLLANFSAQVGILNLLPLGALTDGGKVVRRIIAPLGCAGRTWAALFPLLIASVMLLSYAILKPPALQAGQMSAFWSGTMLVAVWVTSSMLLEANKEVREDHISGKPVTPLQGFLLLLVIWALLALGLVISAGTPFWLAPEYVMGSLQNVADVLRFITQKTL